MPRLEHDQRDPLPISRLMEDRVDYHWSMLEENTKAFDDYTPLSKEGFIDFLFSPICLSMEIGDGIGLSTLIFQGTNAWVQMVMYDYQYRPDVGRLVCQTAFEFGAQRVTATCTEDRITSIAYVQGLGFELEGTQRKAFFRPKQKQLYRHESYLGMWKEIMVDEPEAYLDVYVYGLLKEKFYGGNGSGSGSSSNSCGGNGVRSESAS